MSAADVALEALAAFDQGVTEMEPYEVRIGALVDDALAADDELTARFAQEMYAAVVALENDHRELASERIAITLRTGGRTPRPRLRARFRQLKENRP